jgi:hypothetical protein
MDAPQIFISYRRDNAAGYARAVHDALAREFGAGAVFMDVEDIAVGKPFADVIAQAVGGAGVLLVLMGRRWAGEREGQPPRLFDAGDFVRREVAQALARGMPVMPLLLDGARMPAAAALPPESGALAGLNALSLDNARYAADMARLIAALRSQGTAAAPALAGRWQAEVDYDWPGAHYVEHFDFIVDGDEVMGSASFLGLRRGLQEGRLADGVLRFVTRSQEALGDEVTELLHRYRARLAGDELRFVMQTEGGSAPNEPVSFGARRAD